MPGSAILNARKFELWKETQNLLPINKHQQMAFLTPLQEKKTLYQHLEYTEILWMSHYTLEQW